MLSKFLLTLLVGSQCWIHFKLEKIMTTMEAWQAAFREIDAETTRIGVYIETVVAGLNRTDLTDAQEAVLLTDLQAAATKLKGVGKTPEQPIPPGPELPPVTV